MRFYVFRFLDAPGNVVYCHPIRLSTDAAAIRLARHFLEGTSREIKLQIWHLVRLAYVSSGYVNGEHSRFPARGHIEPLA